MSSDGILVVDKPPGRTSRWVTSRVSRLLGVKKAGHLGTLDPIATGVLPVAVGKATRLISFLEKTEKIYRAEIKLGEATDSQDMTGEVIFEASTDRVDPSAITAQASAFLGEQTQLPPMHSALKVNGTPLYRLARQGVEVERKPRKVTVHSIVVESIRMPLVTLRVRCSAGTYLRTIAHDLGMKLGCGAHLTALVRVAGGPFHVSGAVDIERLSREDAIAAMVPLIDCVPHLPLIEVSEEEAALLEDGVSLSRETFVPGGGDDLDLFRLVFEGELKAVGRRVASEEGTRLKPVKVFV